MLLDRPDPVKRIFSLLAAAALATPCLRGQWDDDALDRLSSDPAAVAEGKKLYQTVCFSCHGHRLEGGTGFALRDGEWLHGSAPSAIMQSVAKGFPEKGMVAFETAYSSDELARVVAFILSEQVGFRNLIYRAHPAPSKESDLDRLLRSPPEAQGRLPTGYADTGITDSDHFAAVFEGELLVPESGEYALRSTRAFPYEVRLRVDGVESPAVVLGGREIHFPVKNGRQRIQLVFHKSDERSEGEFYLASDNLRVPLSKLARDRLAETAYQIDAVDGPQIIRRKIDELPPKSIAVGYPSGWNFAFNPTTNSVAGVWTGGFLDIGPNISGRGKEGSRILGEWLFQEDNGIQLLVNSEAFDGVFQMYTAGGNPVFTFASESRRVALEAIPRGLDAIEFHFVLEGFERERLALNLPVDVNAASDDGTIVLNRLILDKEKRRDFRVTLSK